MSALAAPSPASNVAPLGDGWPSVTDRDGPGGLLAALVSGPTLSPDEQADLVRSAQRGLACSVLLELGVAGADVLAAADAGRASRNRLLESFLPLVLDVCEPEPATPGDSPDESGPGQAMTAFTALLTGIGRFDPDQDVPFEEWIVPFVRGELRAVGASWPSTGAARLRKPERAGRLTDRLTVANIRAALAGVALSPVEQDVLRLRFGLDGHGPRTLAETAAEVGLTRVEARTVEARTVGRLRRHPSMARLRHT